jgi:thiol:disulfide interchange protein/DsbC/DsbD-like thiol-disulfide interchange protein
MSRRFRRTIIATLGVFPIASNCPQSPLPLSRDVSRQGPLAFVRAIGLLGVVAASAQAPAPSIVRATKTRPIEVELVSASRAVVPGETTWVAVRLKPDPGWHTYWRYAGDVGSSFSAAWNLPDGWKAGAFIWPVPHRIASPPLASYGYEREQYLVAPIEVSRSARVRSTARIATRVTWVVCREECVSDDVDLSITRPVAASATTDSAVLRVIVAERGRAPLPQGDWTVRASVDSSDVIILARPPSESRAGEMIRSESRAGDVNRSESRARDVNRSESRASATHQIDFFIDSAAVINHAAPVRARWVNSLLELRVQRSEYANGPPPRVSGVIVFGNADSIGVGNHHALEISAPVAASIAEARVALGAPTVESTFSVTALLAAALLGILGGTLLNLMPCVLPVLSIKLFGLAAMASQSGHAAKRHALRFGAGILLSMWALVGMLLALRAAGNEIGWGYQLQSPVVVSLLAIVMLVAALNMAGVFTIGPIGGRLLSVADRQSGPVQDVMSGALVVLLATPCSAPFISSAAGYALASGAVPAFTVFTAIALGLAWPVVLTAFVPALRRLVPTPGPWMLTLRQFLVFPLLGTAAWLAWVVGRQVGVDVMGALLGAMTIVSLALWLFGTLAHSQRAGVRYAGVALASGGLMLAVSIAVAAASFATAGTVPASTLAGGPATGSTLAWQPYSDSTLRAARASGVPVMLDVTADWCLTCKLNERLALGAERVRAALDSGRVQLLRADWTSRSPEITRLINGFGRSGVPVVVLYPPGDGSQPVLLPTLLTPGIVLDALESMPRVTAVFPDSARVADSTRTPTLNQP